MRALQTYSIKPDSQAFILRLEDAAGHAAEFIVTAEQLDDLIQTADELLEDDDAE